MHELSIALSIVDLATDAADKNGGGKVEALYLKLGKLSGVGKDSLLFSWDLACSGTRIEGARLVIEDVPVTVHCSFCERERTIDSINNFTCPVCGDPSTKVLGGRELQLSAMEIV
jgi:hydrogenase nickel incorporation protein HypA/HybF